MEGGASAPPSPQLACEGDRVAFPFVGPTSGVDFEDRSVTADSTVFDFDTPSGVAATGELLTVVFGFDGAPTWATSPTASGWTDFFNASMGSVVTVRAYYKFSTVTEIGGTTVTARLATAVEGLVDCSRWQDHHATEPPVASSAATGNSTTPDPASLNPSWGATEDTTWEAHADWDSGGSIFTRYPAN
jgi:hypothetical protein